VILVTYLAYGPARYLLPVLSAVDYIGVAAGYLCLAQQTVRDSQSQRRLVRAIYGMFGFAGLLATVAVLGVLCRVWSLSQEVACPAPSAVVINIPRTGTNVSDHHPVYPPRMGSALLLGGRHHKGTLNSGH
jgi:hypothetical protein